MSSTTPLKNSTSKIIQTKKIPTPKRGTKNAQIGKPLDTRKFEPRKLNPLTKAIHVSGFHPDTKTDELAEYIIAHSNVTEKTNFNCFKLIKKDQDISKMSFISFKINVTPDDFEKFINVDIWPEQINIREFVTMTPPKPMLGQFLQRQSPSKISPSQQSKIQKVDPTNESKNNIAIEIDSQSPPIKTKN